MARIASSRVGISITAGIAIVVMAALGCGTTLNHPSSAGSSPANLSSNEPMSAPLIGYVWDQHSSGLRPILGMPGSASLGAPLFADQAYASAAVSLNRQYALFTNAKGEVVLATLPNGEPLQLMNQVSAKQQTTVSPSGSAALIYAPDLTTLTLVQGLPAAPVLRSLHLPAAATAQAAVVSDAGLILIASPQSDGTASIYLVNPSGTSSQIVTASQLGGFAFLPHSSNALIADAGQNIVLLASGLDGTANVSRVASSADGIAQPMAVAASSDGRWGVIANRQGSTVVKVDLTNQAPSSKLQCSCSLAILTSLAGNSVFILTKLSSEAMSVFDGDRANPRIVFIAGLPTASARGAMR